MGRCTSVSKNVWSKSILSSKILWVGCSFVNGMELPDKKVQRFSARVCKNFGQLEWNEGKVGAGNDYIQRYVFNSILQNKLHYSVGAKSDEHLDNVRIHKYTSNGNKGEYKQRFQKHREYCGIGTPKLVVCMWSGINRTELLRQSNITDDWSWVVNTWGKFGLDPKTLTAKPWSQPYVDPMLGKENTNYMRGYMKTVLNAHMNLRKTVNQMLSVKYFLEQKGIKQLHYLFSHGQYRPLLPTLDWEVSENTNNWWESLDLNREQIVSELPFLESEGFYDLCLRKKLPIGPKDHPLIEGHEMMAQRIIQDIKDNEIDKEFN